MKYWDRNDPSWFAKQACNVVQADRVLQVLRFPSKRQLPFIAAQLEYVAGDNGLYGNKRPNTIKLEFYSIVAHNRVHNRFRTGTIAHGSGRRHYSRGGQRAHAERQRQFEADIKESEAALSAARKEWEDALAEAASKRTKAESRSGPDRVKKAEMDLSGLDELIDTTQRKVDVVGTFNPLAAANLGADSLSERTAKASEQVAANTKRLVQEAQHGGLVFA